jgi:hypothetical protein
VTVEELALAYELRQAGCCWKRIAQGLGGDARLISAQVSHLVVNGISKGLDGYQRIPGRKATFELRLIRTAHGLRQRGYTWAQAADELGVEAAPLRKAHRYALNRGMIE